MAKRKKAKPSAKKRPAAIRHVPSQNRDVQVETVDRPNPYFKPEYPESHTNVRSARVTVNLSESTITRLHSRGRIDDAQAEAGLRVRAYYERLAIALRSSSASLERIDGGGSGDVFTEARAVMPAGNSAGPARRWSVT